ncbi:MAG TPA: hypothetical protein DIT50_02970 [Rhodocyclaceae bacterium]|nr:hypothetical protein [Rhodocyclaceae bacterium]
MKGKIALAFAVSMVLGGCATVARKPTPTPTPQKVLSEFGSFWGGDIRCGQAGCRLVAVAHERGAAVVVRAEGRSWVKEGELPTAYHPDSAVWLDGKRFAVAVESGGNLVIAEVDDSGPKAVKSLVVGFPPRDVRAVPNTAAGEVDLIASPYAGNALAYFAATGPETWQQPEKLAGCQTPWHPEVRVTENEITMVAGCLDDRKVVAWSRKANGTWQAQTIAQMPHVPRNVAFSRDGKRLYVALELGGKAAVIEWDQPGKPIHWLPLPGWGAVAVRELADGTVVWGEDRRLFLQRCDWRTWQCETRQLPVDGFAGYLRVADVDQDGHEDVVVFHSAGNGVSVWYGPLWAQAEAVAHETKKASNRN